MIARTNKFAPPPPTHTQLKQQIILRTHSIVPNKSLWALGIHGANISGGRLHRETVCMYMYSYLHANHWGVGTYTETGVYSIGKLIIHSMAQLTVEGTTTNL